MGFTTKLLDILSINATAAKDYIDKLLETKQNKLTFDDAPKKGSTNPVTSDGIRKAIDTATPNVDFSNYPTKNGTGATGTWPISISGAATKASQDSNGKVITDTYLKKAGDTATGDITAPNFIGHLKGNADNATKAKFIEPFELATANSFRSVWFSDSGTNNKACYNSNIQYNPATSVLKTGTFQGYLNGTASNTTTLNNRGNRNPAANGTKVVSGLNLYQVYNNGYPTTYGNVLSIGGTGGGEILAGWSGTDAGMERLYYRNQRDTGTLAWSAWKTVAYTDDISNYAPNKTGSGASGTWGINITGNAATATTTDNAKKLGGYALNTESTGGHFGTIPKVGTDGVMEVGKYIDWHSQNGGSADYTSRWEAQNNGTVTVGTINGTLNGNAATATSATTAGNVSGKIYYSADSPSVATDKLFTIKQAKAGDDNVPNNGLVIQSGPTGAAYNGKLYITDNGADGVWVGGVSGGKEVGWTRLVENKGTWDITTKNIPTSDVGGNIWIA